jgi:hypothetical protein
VSSQTLSRIGQLPGSGVGITTLGQSTNCQVHGLVFETVPSEVLEEASQTYPFTDLPSRQNSVGDGGSPTHPVVEQVSVVGSGVAVLGTSHCFVPQLFAQHFLLSVQPASPSQGVPQTPSLPRVLASGQSPGLVFNGVLQDVPPQESPQHLDVVSLQSVSSSQVLVPAAKHIKVVS